MIQQVTKVLLATHVHPVIHGQAFMAQQLAEQAQDWSDIDFLTHNTAYVNDRDELGRGGLAKIIKFLRFRRDILRRVRKENIQTVIITPAFFRGPFIKDAFMIRALKKYTNAKIIAWVHMDPARLELNAQPQIFQKFAHRSMNMVDLWVACAPSLLDCWPEWIPGRKIAISNAIPDPLEGADPEPPKPDGRFKVGYLSAMDPEKGWQELFQAAKSLCSKHETIEFHFYGGVGQRETKASLMQIFKESGYSDRIQWHGRVDGEEKSKAFQSMDLFVFPSHTEQFPITVLEAMAHKLPIISTDVGAVKDALLDQDLLISGDPERIIKKIINLINSPDKYLAQSSANRNRFEEHFSSHNFRKQWNEVVLNTVKSIDS